MTAVASVQALLNGGDLAKVQKRSTAQKSTISATRYYFPERSEIMHKSGVNGVFWRFENLPDRVQLELEDAQPHARFTTTVFKFVDWMNQHWKLLACFAAGSTDVAEVVAVHPKYGMVMRGIDAENKFPDLTKGYIYQKRDALVLPCPTRFTSGNALKRSMEFTMKLDDMDEKRVENHEETKVDDMTKLLIRYFKERVEHDDGYFKKVPKNQEAKNLGWAASFERPGSEIMQRTGINTMFYLFRNLTNEAENAIKQSQGTVSVLPVRFVSNIDQSEWIALLCFGDREHQMAEVNVINMKTRKLLRAGDSAAFPDLANGTFVEIMPKGKVLRSNDKIITHEFLNEKIEKTANAVVTALDALVE